MTERLRRRSKLITPANRPDLLMKAASSAADVIQIELEDGIPQEGKAAARAAAKAAMGEIDWGDGEVWIRVNAVGSSELRFDLDELVPAMPAAFLVPKVNGVDDVEAVVDLLRSTELRHGINEGEIKVAVVIERIHALAQVEAIAAFDPRITALVLGTEDMSLEYGYRLDRAGPSLETLYLKSRCVLAARLAGVDCIDAGYFRYRDLEGTRASAEFSAALGFTGKTCISPRQVPAVNEAFAPTLEEVAWAEKVLAALDAAAHRGLSVAVVDGLMVDAPHASQARQILVRTGRADL